MSFTVAESFEPDSRMRHRWFGLICLLFMVTGLVSVRAEELPANTWVKLQENGVGQREGTCVVYVPGKDYFLAFGGRRGKKVKTHEQPYSEMTFSLKEGKWKNKFPGGREWGEATGSVKTPGWKERTRSGALGLDKEGVLRPYIGRYSSYAHNGYAYAYDPRDEQLLVLGAMDVGYDLKTGKWRRLNSEGHPGTPRLEGIDFKEGRTSGPVWSQAIYDPDNREVMQFGGAGVISSDSRPRTWIYNIDQNKWRRHRPGSDALKALSQTAHTVKKKTLSMIAGYRNRYYRTELKNTAAVPLKELLSSRLSMKDLGALFEQLRSSASKVDKHEMQQLRWAADEVKSAAKSYKAVLDSADGGTDKSVLTNQLMEVKKWVRRLHVSLSPEPPARCYAPMAYSPDHKKILMFGGYGLNHVRNDTWVYDTGSRRWRQFRPEKNPSARFGHACVYLPKDKVFVVLGGQKSHFALSHGSKFSTVEPPDAWAFDVENGEWRLIKRDIPVKGEGNPLPRFGSGIGLKNYQTYAVNRKGVLFTVRSTPRRYRTGRTETWACRLDASVTDGEGTEEHGAGPWAFDRPDNKLSARWYDRNQPEPDPEKFRQKLENLPENKWVKISDSPVYVPGWNYGSVKYSAERDELFALTGGHSTHHGSAIFRYSMKTDRWHCDYDGQQALTYGYFCSYIPYAYDWRPFMPVHYWDAYGYDPADGTVITPVYRLTLSFDPGTGAWQTPRTRAAGNVKSMLQATPEGLYIWADRTIYQYKAGEGYVAVHKNTIPEASSADRAFFTYDTKRNRLVYGSTHKKYDVFTYSLETGKQQRFKPDNQELMKGAGMLREFEYIPSADLVFDMKGLAWAPEENRWIQLNIDAKATGGGKTAHTSQGMVYDPHRDLIWAANNIFRESKAVTVLKLNAKTARQE